jgi:tellurite methyltransferase
MSEDDRVRWEARHSQPEPLRPPTPFLDEVAALLPRAGRALDVAGGTGRHALWLLAHGLDVTLVDIAEAALQRARALAASTLPPAPALTTVTLDLERESIPAGPFALVLCTYFLQRSLFADLTRVLEPGGALVVVHPTRSNLQRHPHPSARFLLDDGELPTLVGPLTIVRYQEGWFPDQGGQPIHEARLLARR